MTSPSSKKRTALTEIINAETHGYLTVCNRTPPAMEISRKLKDESRGVFKNFIHFGIIFSTHLFK